MKKFKKDDLQKAVTLEVLMEYTDDFLLPSISDIMDEKLKPTNIRLEKVEQKLEKVEQRLEKVETKVSKVEYNLKVYIDEKMADYTSDIFKRLEKKYQQDKHFKQKIVELLKKHNIGEAEEIAFLEGLVSF